MTTTILPDMQVPVFPRRPDILDQAFHIILAGNYLLVFFLAEMSEFSSLHAWGSRQITPSLFLGFLVILAGLHLVLLFPTFSSRQRRRILGGLQVACGILTLGILLLSGPSMTLLRVSSPSPLVVFGLLLLTICYGIVQFPGRKDPLPGGYPADLLASRFPENLRPRYAEVRFLASGGVGTVWYARYAGDGQEVAIKIPSRSDEQTGRAFLQEIQLWKELNHPSIVRINAANILPVPYVEMEYLPRSLAMIPVPVSLPETLRIMLPITSALSYAHQQGVVHCDIKPGNILLDREGNPKITDWGLARGRDSIWAIHGFSTRYAAPEQCGPSPDCGPGVDVYQAGLILAWLITGVADLPSETEPVFSDDQVKAVYTIIIRCLNQCPSDRYADCTELYDTLNSLG